MGTSKHRQLLLSLRPPSTLFILHALKHGNVLGRVHELIELFFRIVHLPGLLILNQLLLVLFINDLIV